MSSTSSNLKFTSRTLFKVKKQNKIRCAQFGKIKGMTWQKDAFSDDAWMCRVSQTQWRWMAKCSRHARSDEERAVTNRRTTRRWCDKGRRRRRSQPLSCIHVRQTTWLARQVRRFVDFHYRFHNWSILVTFFSRIMSNFDWNKCIFCQRMILKVKTVCV